MESLNVAWWHWLVVGIVLLALELLTPGALFLIFFAAAAIVVGLLAAVGLAGPLITQIVLFSLISLVALVTLRRLLVAKLSFAGQPPAIDQMVGETALALEDIAVDAIGKIELRGAAWSARNASQHTLTRGARCTVLRVEGLTLWVCEELSI